MDEFILKAIERVPLAEAVLLLWRWATTPERLQSIWDRNRGRCYDKVIEFPVMVNLISDALLICESGRESFQKNIENGTLEASIQAAYKKLGRIPVAVSEAFLLNTTSALREAFPDWAQWKSPSSLRNLQVVIFDGKALKKVAKRLKRLRGVPGGLLGGRALVAIDWETGLAIAMRGDLDGDSNEVKHVKDLVPQVGRELPSPKLYVSDRAFCDLEQPRHFTAAEGDHFLVRYHPKVKFHVDSSVRERRGTNNDDQQYVETWGYLGSERDPRRRNVRRIELMRPDKEPVILITDLLDPKRYPATDLLWIYRERWEIERLFQQVTEVFGLSHLIGTTPQATLFQFSFCMVLYNMVQVIRGYIAQVQDRQPSDISTELMFRDVARQMSAWHFLITPEQTQSYFMDHPALGRIQRRLRHLLRTTWSDSWLASPPQSIHRTTAKRRARTHGSVYRILFGPPPKKRRTNLAKKRCLQQ